MTVTASYFASSRKSGFSLAAGDRVRVAHAVFGRVGWVTSTSPGHVVVQYDRGGREIIDPTRRSVWIVK